MYIIPYITPFKEFRLQLKSSRGSPEPEAALRETFGRATVLGGSGELSKNWDYIGVVLGFYRGYVGDGKENGSCYTLFRV